MDFQSFTRRELQALCKRNKIPANMSNVAMADALKALEIVEGIEDFLHPSESETALSSIESPGKSEVTSPCMPPTGSRTTRRTNVPKTEPETLQPVTRTRRTTRKTSTKDEPKVDANETPAVVPRIRRAPLSSACRKMDSQLQECVEDEKKQVLATPAASGVTSRRRKGAKEETAVKTVYSTRRSVRLAEKQVEMLNKVEVIKSEPVQTVLFSKDGDNLNNNLKENLNDLDEISGITGVDGNMKMGEKPDGEDEPEVVSTRERDLTISTKSELVKGVGKEPAHHLEEENINLKDDNSGCNFENEQESVKKEHVFCEKYCNEVCPEIENAIVNMEELNTDNNEEYGEKADSVESQGCHEIYASENEIVALDNEELNMTKDAGSGDKADCLLEHEDSAFDKVICETETCGDDEKEVNDDKNPENEEVLKITAEADSVNVSRNQDVSCGNGINLAIEKEIDLGQTIKEVSSPEMNLGDFTSADSVSAGLLTVSPQHKNEDPDEMQVDQHNCISETADQVPLSYAPSHPLDEPYSLEGDNSSKAMEHLTDVVEDSEGLPHSIGEEQIHQIPVAITQPHSFTPAKNSASKVASAMKKRLTAAVTDNKENIGSGSKLVVMKESTKKIAKGTVENGPKLDDLSLRKLCKLLKEKLEMTNKKFGQNENGNEARTRPALQDLPGNNRQIDETRN